MPVPEKVLELIKRFDEHREAYTSPEYNETQTRREFIDPLFEAMGWDIENRQGFAEPFKHVVHEDSLRVGAVSKAPDYSFRIGGRRFFFLEAKKPSVNLKIESAPAFQLRRYAWTAKLPVSILTDFEEFAVYDTRIRPDVNDPASHARVLYITYDQYAERWDEIISLFSLEAIQKGSLDKFVESTTKRRGTATVDEAFLAEIEEWRDLLARNIALRNPGIEQRELNYAVQITIDRIVFLRICEDRAIEDYGQLLALLNGTEVYLRLRVLYERADERYNSGLFHFHKEKDRHGDPDTLTPKLRIDDKVLKLVIKRLYYPESPYEFSVFPAEILGQVYERFLGNVIRLTSGGQAKVEEKPEVRKAGGVYYTPSYIVDYIVKHTLGRLLDGKTPQEVAGCTENWRPAKSKHPLAILDPACGSGSFLLGAYQYLLNWHLEQYAQDPEKWMKTRFPRIYKHHRGGWRLTTVERKRILLANIYGVDIDRQAVEVTKLSLLLKVLEDETAETLNRQFSMFHERALPDLAGNIKCGNSLIGPEFYNGRQMELADEEELFRVNPFNWHNEFPGIMKNGGFDLVIGNPPYIRIQAMREWASAEVDYMKKAYQSARSGSYDIYVVFIEKGLELLNNAGRFGMILPSKFFTTDYGAGTRRIISSKKLLYRLVDFGHQQVFPQVSTYTCLLFLTKSSSPNFARIRPLQPIDISSESIASRVLDATSISAVVWSFSSSAGTSIKQRLDLATSRLGAISRISRGSSTGADDVFILTKTREGFISSSNTIVDLEEAALRVPVFASAVQRYQFSPDTSLRVIYPYVSDSSEVRLLSEVELSGRFPKTFAYLRTLKSRLLERRHKGAWYGFSAPRSLAVHEKAHILVPLLADRGLFAPLQPDGLRFCLMAGGGFSVSIDEGQLDPKFVLGIMNSKLMFWYLKTISNRFRGGWITCTKQYIETIPLPTPGVTTELIQPKVVRLVDQIVSLNKQVQSATTPHTHRVLARRIDAIDQEIESIVEKFYGINADEFHAAEEEAATS